MRQCRNVLDLPISMSFPSTAYVNTVDMEVITKIILYKVKPILYFTYSNLYKKYCSFKDKDATSPIHVYTLKTISICTDAIIGRCKQKIRIIYTK